MPKDLTQASDNPTRWLHDNYTALMGIQNPEELYNYVVEAFVDFNKRGALGNENFRKFKMDIDRALSGGMARLQSYLSNYMLAGAGMRAEWANSTPGMMATMITEDLDCNCVALTEEQERLAALVESYGFTVTLCEENVLDFVEEEELISEAGSTQDALQEALALLRAQQWNYWSSHWQAQGDNAYGNHLLFQRLYEGMEDRIDALAEKIVGYFGAEAVDDSLIIEKTQKWIKKWEGGELVSRAILSEHDMQSTFKTAYDRLKDDDALSLGLDDYLMAAANDHETNLYLLQQVDKS